MLLSCVDSIVLDYRHLEDFPLVNFNRILCKRTNCWSYRNNISQGVNMQYCLEKK
jgi:hypothetical protein